MVCMCTRCLELFKQPSNFCYKIGCAGEVVEVDELMLPIIKKLNQLKFNTAYCCSGHIYDHKDCCYPYIRFDKTVDMEKIKNTFNNLPSPWYFDEDDDLRCRIKEKNEIDKYKAIFEANLKLLEYISQFKKKQVT